MTKCDECGTTFGFHARTCSRLMARAPRPPETVHLDPGRPYCALSSKLPGACDSGRKPIAPKSGSDVDDLFSRAQMEAAGGMIVNRADLRRLVFAARDVAFEDNPPAEMVRELDAASELFADSFDWTDQPEPEPSDPAVDGVEAMLAEHYHDGERANERRELAERIVAGLRDQGVVQ